ncbi:MAG: GNAT family N-acetyltransferase [Ktedonobacteraceae bacterium]|nr:GNAT family N-acetyltransferase [Ktedonobacteraceae bacterium]
MDQKDSQVHFLEIDPTREQQWQALSLNIQTWFARSAEAGAKEVVSEPGITWTSEHLAISSVNPLQIGDQLDRALNWYRRQHPLEGAICWYVTSAPPGDLAARLFARGFEPNWQPHWMWCKLRDLSNQHSHSPSFDIQIVEDEPAGQVNDLPYYPANQSKARAALHRMYPRHVRSLAAAQQDQVVGRCVLNVTTGEWGIAGLFAMAVIPAARNQGIGTALAWESCNLARQMGCHHVMLNATPMGEPVYRRVGFQSMGYSPSWYLRTKTLAAPPLANNQVLFLEAVGRGDLIALDELGKHVENRFLSDPLPNGLTPLDIAVHCRQPASVDWLVSREVPLDLLSAWDIGWKERVHLLLIEQPELVNIQRGEGQLTPLHIAVQRDDIELAKILLTVPNNLDLKDSEFKATALGWAQYFQRREITALIEQHHANQNKPDH